MSEPNGVGIVSSPVNVSGLLFFGNTFLLAQRLSTRENCIKPERHASDLAGVRRRAVTIFSQHEHDKP